MHERESVDIEPEDLNVDMLPNINSLTVVVILLPSVTLLYSFLRNRRVGFPPLG
jgi:hypothetical protein